VAGLKAHLENEMQRQHVAGMMLTIVTKDSVWYAGGLGYADVNRKTPVTEKHLFRQASITKLFTALAVLQLVQAGKLQASDRLRDLAPEIPFENQWEPMHPVTVAGLLEHSTGFSDKSPFEEYNFSGQKGGGVASLRVFRKFMASRWQPGERHAYSAVNYAILAYLVERISGKPFGEYLREKVFSPLGMPTANVGLTDAEPGTYSKGYVWKENGFQYVPHQPQYNPGYGSLNAGALDFAAALQAYLRDWQTPQGPFLSRAVLVDSETPHTYLSAREGLKHTYAYGNEVYPVNGHFFRGHQGSIGGYLSGFSYNRSLGLGYAVSINTYNEGFFRYAVDLIGRFVTRDVAVPAPPAVYPVRATAVQPYEGYYRFGNPRQLYFGFLERYQHTFKLKQNGDALAARLLLGGTMQWKAADQGRLWFRHERAGHPHILLGRDGNGEPVITDRTMYFTKISAFEAWAPLLLLLLSALVLLSSLLYGFRCVVLFLLRKMNRSAVLVRVSPALAVLGLFLVLWVNPQIIGGVQEGTPLTTPHLVWTLGKYSFAFFSLCTIVLLVLHRKRLGSRWLKGYLTLSAAAGCYLLALLVMNHWY
jgi:CubicO group peptidase (beta-lactamase class C family)